MCQSSSGLWLLASALTCLLASAVPARADATLYAGALTGGGGRTVVGGSIGFFPRQTGSVIGFEIDYARTPEKGIPTRHRVETSGANLLMQVYVIPRRLQAYGAMGGGIFRQTMDGAESASGLAANFGGGVKIALAGPLKIRLDYRLFVLSQSPDATLERLSYKHPQRVTAGLALAF